jgi:hypothetical protein
MSVGRGNHEEENMISLLIAGLVSGVSYVRTRAFVGERLRYVDAVQNGAVPVVVGTVAALAAAPVVWALPFVGAGTAMLFGLGVGAGTRAGVARIRREVPVMLPRGS